MSYLNHFLVSLLSTIRDVLPIAIILFGFQLVILRKRIPNLRQILIGFVFVLLGLAFFLEGLEQALFPLGKLMAEQLTAPEFLGITSTGTGDWTNYLWVYVFAFAIGFSTTIAEPSLIAERSRRRRPIDARGRRGEPTKGRRGDGAGRGWDGAESRPAIRSGASQCTRTAIPPPDDTSNESS